MSIDDRDYIAAWRRGGSRAVEALLDSRGPTADARIRELELLECLGNWDVLWQRNATSRTLAGAKSNPILPIGQRMFTARAYALHLAPGSKAATTKIRRRGPYRPGSSAKSFRWRIYAKCNMGV